MVEEFHFAPKALNESLSAEIFTLFIDGVDADGSFFTEEDLQSLNSLAWELYKQIKDSASCEFIGAVNTVYGQRLQSFAKLIEAFGQEKLDLKKGANFKEKSARGLLFKIDFIPIYFPKVLLGSSISPSAILLQS